MWKRCSGFSLFLDRLHSGSLSEVIMWQLFGRLEQHGFMGEHAGRKQRLAAC